MTLFGRFGPIAGSLLAAAWIGCAEEAPRSPARPAAPAAAGPVKTPVASAEKVEVPSVFAKTADDYSYNPVGKRDPFKPFRGDVVQGPDVPKSPLEQFDLDQLKVTAIVWGIASPRALLAAPDGQSYIIRRDLRVGKNRGRVSRITRREVFVKEEYRDPTGKLVVREITLEISPKEDEQKLKLLSGQP